MIRFWAILLAVFLVGCSTPWSRNNKAVAKVDKAQSALIVNERDRMEVAKSFTFGADYSLTLDPDPSVYSTTAQNLTSRSLLASGIPAAEEALRLRKIVDGLVSTNDLLKINAQKALETKDQELIGLQNENTKLETTLKKAEENFKAVAAENAQLAQFLAKLKRIWAWIKWTFLTMVVLRIAAVFLPPPYNFIGTIFDTIFGGLFKLGSKVLPKAKEAAGVVGQEVYHESNETLKQLVSALQEVRKKEINPADASPRSSTVKLQDIIDPILRDHTSKEQTRRKIVEIKTQLGHI